MDLWKVSMDFVVDLYRITGTFPDHEKFGLVSQLRRAGVFICSNIAEGAAENHPRELLNLYPFLESVYEINTQLEIAFRLGYIKSMLLSVINLFCSIYYKTILNFFHSNLWIIFHRSRN